VNKLIGLSSSLPDLRRKVFVWGALVFADHAHAELYKWTTRKARFITPTNATLNSQTVKHSTAGQAETTSKATQSLDAKDQAYQKRRKEAEDAVPKPKKRRNKPA